MFLFVGLISGPGSVGASLAECSMSRVKFASGEFSKNWGASEKISWERLSVTWRRGLLTSRRHF